MVRMVRKSHEDAVPRSRGTGSQEGLSPMSLELGGGTGVLKSIFRGGCVRISVPKNPKC